MGGSKWPKKLLSKKDCTLICPILVLCAINLISHGWGGANYLHLLDNLLDNMNLHIYLQMQWTISLFDNQ